MAAHSDRPTLLPPGGGPAPLDLYPDALVLQPALLRTLARAGRDTRRGRVQAGGHEVLQALPRILAVALLGAVALGVDHQHPIVGDPAVAPGPQALAHRRRQRRRTGNIEAQ